MRWYLQLLAVLALGAGATFQAHAGSADIEGSISYQISGDRITIEIDRIANNTSTTTTGTLYVTVHVTTASSVNSTGYYVARHRITGSSNGQLGPGRYFSNIRWTLEYTAPPAGTYYVHFFTSQYPNIDTVLDSRTFTERLVVSDSGGGGSADIEGSISYQISGDRITIEIDRIANNTSNRTTGTLYVTVRMTEGSSISSTGHNVARHRITGSSNGQLGPGRYFSNIRWTLDYTRPPPGTYHVHFFTSQYPDEDTALDSRTFTGTLVVGGGGGGDHGDDAASASRIPTNSTTDGSLERGGDKDFFRIELPRTGDLVVETTGNTDTYGVLTNADNSLRRTNDDGGERSNFRISLDDAAPGVYYIEVRGYSGSTTGDYSLSVSFTPTADTRPGFSAGSAPGDQNYTVGAAITALTLPAATGGDGALTYTLTPAVPGLSFDAATRRLSGTPSAAGTYALTYTATDIDGDSATLRFSITVQAAGGGGGVAADGSFALHGENRWPEGITHAAGRFHVVDFWDEKVYAYQADGARDEPADFDLHGDNRFPAGIAHSGDRFHVLDSSDYTVYAYRADGRRDRSSDFDLHADNGWPTGIVHSGDRFHVIDFWDGKVYAYRADGRRDRSSDFDLHDDNGWPVGIAHAGDRFHVVDVGEDKVYAYRADGQRDESLEFDLSAGNDDAVGIVHIDGWFHVVDAGDEKVYAYRGREQSDGLLRTLSGVVSNYNTGTAIAGATIRITQYANGITYDLGSAITDNNGQYEVQTTAYSGKVNINAVAEGFAPQSVIVRVREEVDDSPANLAMLPVQFTTRFQPTEDQDNTHFSMLAGSLTTDSGAAPSGEVIAMVTELDASSDTTVMPGDFTSLNPDTEVSVPIESFGAMNIEFMTEDGSPLNLGDGQEATVKIPLAERQNPGTAPQTIPLFYYSDTMASWIEDGEARLQEVDGEWAYVGSVSHFSTWNADIPYETVQLQGCVNDVEGNPVAQALVTATGRDYIGSSSALTNLDGRFDIPVRQNSEILVSALSGTHTNTLIVRSGSTGSSLGSCLVLSEEVGATIKLTWGENPRDLDSHFYGPGENGGTFHVSYGNRSVSVAGTVINLDVDDTTSFGPEIVTIIDFPFPGTYHYFVHHYSGSSTIRMSPARVELNLGGERHVFSPEMASGADGDRVWAVFQIEVDQNFTPEVIPIQQFRRDLGP